jgi:arylsulfatase
MHVPLIVYHPDYEGGRSIRSVTSHIDLATTFIHMSGLSAERKAEVAEGLPGKNLMELIDGTSQSVRRGALFCNELISTTMARAVRDVNGAIQYYTFDTTVRGLVRAAITERYKFARYFGGNFNTPTTMEALLRDNDIELYDLENDPGELNNLALDPEANAELIMEMNALLNELIASEIGEDNGDEFHEMIAAYNATLRKESGGCSTASVPAGLLLLLALLPLLRRRK